MKAKELKLGDPVYRAGIKEITIFRIISLSMDKGNVRIEFSGSHYRTEMVVTPDAEAIIPNNPYEVRYYFDKKGAQLRQLRMRNDAIESAKANLEKAAQLYAETLATYQNVPPTEPVE